MKRKSKVIWTDHAKLSLQGIYEYIQQDSPTAAKRVVKRLVSLSKTLSTFPERHTKESLLETKGNYRFLAIWRYKIVYEVFADKVIIADIFDTSQNPNKLKIK